MADLSGNLLLDWLPATARRACLEASERIELRSGEEIVTQGDRGRYAFFPANAVCSLTMGLTPCDKAQCASAGQVGLVQESMLTAPPRSSFSAVVQIPGVGYRAPVGAMEERLKQQ